MQRFEYKVVPAPVRGEKAKGARTTAERFALTLTQVMNTLGAEGWEYVRADTLPCEERVGLTGKASSYQNMLVFRRVLGAARPAAAPAPVAAETRAPLIPDAPQGAAPPVTIVAPSGTTAPGLGPARAPEIAAE